MISSFSKIHLLIPQDMQDMQDIVAQACLHPLEIRSPEAGPKHADHGWRRVSVRQPVRASHTAVEHSE
jgi:hypothetical protein